MARKTKIKSLKKPLRRKVFISGASSGIGAATAKLFAAKDFDLFLVGRRRDRLEKLAKEIGSGVKIQLATFDISKKTAIDQFVKKFAADLVDVEVLINSAGLAKGADAIQNSSIDDWEEMIDVNIKGLFYLTRMILPFMLERHSGHIVNMGSVAGRWLYPGGAIYCATKHAVKAFSEGLRMDLIGKNIRVTNIAPGMVNTEFSTVRFGSKEKADAVYNGMKPLTAEDIAETIVWSVMRPAHVNIQEMLIYPTDQAHVNMVHRRTATSTEKNGVGKK